MPSAQTQPISCDSCGLPASPEHIAARLARLELATRYRPVHISTLLVCTAPPTRVEDDLYSWESNAASSASRSYLASLLACAGVAREKSPADQLAEFQRLGFYLARLVECPLDPHARTDDLARRYGPTLIKRIQLSYKPRHVALLGPVAPGLKELLLPQLENLLVNAGQGIVMPAPSSAAAVSEIRAVLSPASAS
ncbi:MAG TPA: hypothetical protein VFO34_07145 [Candidatus Acidoferrales bacterium]|nr:hypothetical protein [Candidatus Acidoferrales bacterium]